jgi:hypothetical protein
LICFCPVQQTEKSISVKSQKLILDEGLLAGICDFGSLSAVIDIGLSSLALCNIITEDFHLSDIGIVPAAYEILIALVADTVLARVFDS